MIATLIINGKMKLILSPENEIEKIALKEFGENKVGSERTPDGVTILGKAVPDSLILTVDKTKE